MAALPDFVPIKRALLSLSNKHGLIPFAQALSARGVALISTGGTAQTLRDAGLVVEEVAQITGFPEMMEGRVKTLHPHIHGALLGVRDKTEHQAALASHAIEPIDLLVVNLYPFAQTLAQQRPYDEIIENIDIGGPAMLRSAAKNHRYVSVVCDSADYALLIETLDAHAGATPYTLRQRLAAKAFSHTASYDSAIASYFNFGVLGEMFPQTLTLALSKQQDLRYGENPHQHAALYQSGFGPKGLVGAQQHQGKALSYNNLNDSDAALELISAFADGPPTVAIIKHANPCGVASGETLVQAYERALACDPTSAFGGIIATNRPLDAQAATAISTLFTEVVIAPGADSTALEIFAQKKNLRLLTLDALSNAHAPGLSLKSIAGGYLLQSRDHAHMSPADLKVVTKRTPTPAELEDLLFAFRVAKYVKSNAIVFAKNQATLGIGAGQMSRIDSTKLAQIKAQEAGLPLSGAVAASDAFFPFADGVVAAAQAGISALIQPGGSIRDAEVIEAADALGLAMVFTGVRHFRH